LGEGAGSAAPCAGRVACSKVLRSGKYLAETAKEEGKSIYFRLFSGLGVLASWREIFPAPFRSAATSWTGYHSAKSLMPTLKGGLRKRKEKEISLAKTPRRHIWTPAPVATMID
jgi:hypothetical protein